MAALFDWLHGRPWPGAGRVAQLPGFRQLGWAVDWRASPTTPSSLSESAPLVTVRVKLDRS